MVGIGASTDSNELVILGHGITVPERFELVEGVFVDPSVPGLNVEDAAAGSRHFADYAAAIQGHEMATFALRVERQTADEELARRGWNALWLFHLLSLACRSPCVSLYSVSDGPKPLFGAANRNPFVRPVELIHPATPDQLGWAKRHYEAFNELTAISEFSSAMRCYGNAHQLPDMEVRIMLLWAGIEGLLSVDAELNRRLAQYAALMLDGTPAEKAAYFDEVRKAYAIRSRAVHGGKAKPAKLEVGYASAASILVRLLARCVELGRVPTPSELDHLAVSSTLR